MSKVTSKLQVTIPKAIAQAHAIRPGTDVVFESAGEAVRMRLLTGGTRDARHDVGFRLKLFQEDTARQESRNRAYRRVGLRQPADRGWKREDLYTRGNKRGLPR